MNHGPPTEARVLAGLAALRAGTTMCPGMLAKRLGVTLPQLRPVLADLQRRELLLATRRGAPFAIATGAGAFRVAPAVPGGPIPER